MTDFRTLQIAGNLEELGVQRFCIDILTDIDRIVEKRLHQPTVVFIFLGKSIIDGRRRRVHLRTQQSAVLLIQKIHVTMGGIVMDFHMGAHP